MTDCNGDGVCLRQGDGPDEYEINNCLHKCKPVECPNFKVCGVMNPLAILDCHRGKCFNCDMMFGKLTFYESVECPICFEDKSGVKQINCDHKVCIDCFKRCHYGTDNIPQPIFPYPCDIEDEYDNDPDDSKWINDPLIIKYIEDWILYESNCDEAYYRETSLRICGICRK